VEIRDRTIVVTGAASGIGRALALGFADEGAAHVVVADRDDAGARAVADDVDRRGSVGVARCVDVTVEGEIAALVDDVERDVAPIDLACSNAGILVVGGVEVPDDEWRRILDVNVMAHVHMARHLVPRMLDRGGGYLLNTASAAGLLAQVGSAPYSVTKHAAVAFAEWLAITYGERGLKVSVLCPQAVDTPMIAGTVEGGVAGVDGVLDPAVVAEVAVAGLADERFLILPHPEVADYLRRKGDDPERWIAGMQRLQRRFSPGP
jgi:NAD(P)-dependent dehydrogenase (short-subunit alcohol dehydrogenase family)